MGAEQIGENRSKCLVIIMCSGLETASLTGHCLINLVNFQ